MQRLEKTERGKNMDMVNVSRETSSNFIKFDIKRETSFCDPGQIFMCQHDFEILIKYETI